MDRKRGLGLVRLAKGVAIIAIASAPAAILSGCSTLRATGDSLRAVGHDVSESTHFAPLGVNPASPVAADVERAEHTDAPVPSFASVPPKPKDIRSASAYKGQVMDLVGDRRTLGRLEATNSAPESDTEAYAAAQRAKVAGEPGVSANQPAESNAFAARLREAAGAPSSKPAPAKKPRKAVNPAKSPNQP